VSICLAPNNDKETCLGIHNITRNILIRNMLAKLGPQFCFNLLEIKRLHRRTRSSIDPRLVPDNLRTQRLRETSDRLTQVALEELDYGRREIEFRGTSEDISFGERVGSHPLGEITDDFGGGSYFDDVTALQEVRSTRYRVRPKEKPTSSLASIYFCLIILH